MTPGHRLRVIRYAAWYHSSIGTSIGFMLAVGITVPRPWDSMEAYFQYLPMWSTALLFIMAAALSVAALHARDRMPWLLALGVVPQQLLILWGAGWQALTAAHELDPRDWLSLMPISGLAYLHGREVKEVWDYALRTPTGIRIMARIALWRHPS